MGVKKKIAEEITIRIEEFGGITKVERESGVSRGLIYSIKRQEEYTIKTLVKLEEYFKLKTTKAKLWKQ